MAQGLTCQGVWTANPHRAGRPSPSHLGFKLLTWDEWQEARANLLILAPGDHAMEELVSRMSQCPKQESTPEVRCALHLSGSLSKDVLAPLEQLGYGGAAIHPLRAFAQHETDGKSLRGVFCGLEEGSAESEGITSLFASAGGKVMEIPSKSKGAYHGSATMATNLVVALLHTAEKELTRGAPKIPWPRDVIASLAQSALDSYREKGAKEALTGPIERQDLSVIQTHLEAISPAPSSLEVYRALSLAALELAREKSGCDLTKMEAIRLCLDGISTKNNS